MRTLRAAITLHSSSILATALAITAAGGCEDDGGKGPFDGVDDGHHHQTTGGTTDDTAAPSTTEPNVYTDGGDERCVLLFGGNDRVRGPDEGLPVGAENRTLQAWVRTSSLREQIAISHGRPSPNQGFMLGTADGWVMARAGSGNASVVGDVFVADDAWHHLTAAYDGRLVVLTVDGAMAGTGDLVSETLEGDVVAGNTPTGDLTKPWIGWLDDVRVFSVSRLPGDIAADLDGVDEDGLELWWDFELKDDTSGPGVTVPDLSGNGHDATTGGDAGSPTFPACR